MFRFFPSSVRNREIHLASGGRQRLVIDEPEPAELLEVRRVIDDPARQPVPRRAVPVGARQMRSVVDRQESLPRAGRKLDLTHRILVYPESMPAARPAPFIETAAPPPRPPPRRPRRRRSPRAPAASARREE